MHCQTSNRHVAKETEQSDTATRRLGDEQRQASLTQKVQASFDALPTVPAVVGFPFAPPFMLPAYRRRGLSH
jgi:hypothetical protein